MIDPRTLAFFKPDGLRSYKSNLFDRIGGFIEKRGGVMVRGDIKQLEKLANQGRTPVVGCTPELRYLIDAWLASRKTFLYWDRGYARRTHAAQLPRDDSGQSGFYRWHCNSFQATRILDVPNDRWKALRIPLVPWRKNGEHILVLCPTPTYSRFHNLTSWTDTTVRALSFRTQRPLMIRDKESRRDLRLDLEGCHAVVGHGTNALVEAAVLGTPVFCDPSSACVTIGHTDLSNIETPLYPDREKWAASLAYNQWSEAELVSGAIWPMLG